MCGMIHSFHFGDNNTIARKRSPKDKTLFMHSVTQLASAVSRQGKEEILTRKRGQRRGEHLREGKHLRVTQGEKRLRVHS